MARLQLGPDRAPQLPLPAHLRLLSQLAIDLFPPWHNSQQNFALRALQELPALHLGCNSRLPGTTLMGKVSEDWTDAVDQARLKETPLQLRSRICTCPQQALFSEGAEWQLSLPAILPLNAQPLAEAARMHMLDIQACCSCP